MRDNRAAVNRSLPRSVTDNPQERDPDWIGNFNRGYFNHSKKGHECSTFARLGNDLSHRSRLIEHRVETDTRSTECVCFFSGYSSG